MPDPANWREDAIIEQLKEFIQYVRLADYEIDTPEFQLAQRLADAILDYERAKGHPE